MGIVTGRNIRSSAELFHTNMSKTVVPMLPRHRETRGERASCTKYYRSDAFATQLNTETLIARVEKYNSTLDLS